MARIYIYIFTDSAYPAKIGALLYTFSGFTIVNTSFYFFLDAIAVFPFLWYGLEKLIRNNQKNSYIFALLINAVINYYFFVSTVILTIFYVFFRLELFCKDGWKQHWHTLLIITICSVIGTGLASFALLPSLIKIANSGKASASIGSAVWGLFSIEETLERIRILISPIESNRFHVFYNGSSFSSVGVYLPVFGIYGAVVAVNSRQHRWLNQLYLLLLICLLIKPLNAMFNLFSSGDYSRWLYGPALLLSLGTALALKNGDYRKQTNQKILLTITVTTVLLLVVPTAFYLGETIGLFPSSNLLTLTQTYLFMGFKRMLVVILVTCINYIVLWVLVRKSNLSSQKVIFCVCFACCLNYGMYNLINYDFNSTGRSNSYYYDAVSYEVAPDEAGFFRCDYPPQIFNYGMFQGFPSVNYYNSLQNSNSLEFAIATGIATDETSVAMTTPDCCGVYMDALLSVKYYLAYDDNADIPDGFVYSYSDTGVAVYQNSNYIPMGFTYDSYCTVSELIELPVEKRALQMLSTIVINDCDEAEVCKLLSHGSVNVRIDSFDNLVKKRRSSACSIFEASESGFYSSIKLDQDNIVFFSIPADNGWTITVNGKPATVFRVNCGLLGIACAVGENEIICTYQTPGLPVAIGLSMLFLLIWLAYLHYGHIRKSSHIHRNELKHIHYL